ncbi:MAG: ABC transporter substrate-binding protein [Methanobrevibacter sp.]|uniref:ABC transporter substrate-binding protein n=1 Tax=Methanobrevibacter millerae TaxID=230361 RepID=A0A8T3VHU4_9EURY|nr:ABC transporter substrate-binding protein [Methanobrevibacter millerae]MBE6504331.1 ABC transporter substrate-binding protein [Methanobrevibacter millerae]MBR0371872.1 ABC transporter substrate-binding protein [Methanobrevibacter sp.]
MNKKIGVILAVALIALLAMGTVSAGWFDFLGGGSSDNKVTIGYLPSDHDAALFVADQQGLYKAKGIETELVQFNNGGDLMTAMASGKVDVGYVGISPVLSSVEKGVPVKVISAAQNEGSGIVISNNSGISSAADLNGKNVATPGEASIQYVLLNLYLKNNGLSMDKVNASAMKTPSINDAINTNTIDAGVTFQPFVSTSEANGNKVLATSNDILAGHPCCVVVASQDIIDKKPDTVKDIVAIHENATKFINDNVKENASAVVDLLPSDIVSNKTVEANSLASFPFLSGLNDTYKANVDAFMQLEVDLGILNNTIPHEKLFWEGK